MITLALDASTYTASLAVLDQSRVVAHDQVAMRGADEERLMPAVAALLEGAQLAPAAIDRIVCGAGPGSFTSLRIAVSIAKGFAFGADIPLLGISSLALQVAGSDATQDAGRYVAAVDALRDEHYVTVCDVASGGGIASLGPVQRWPSAGLRDRAAAIGALVGPGLPVDALPDVTGLPRLRDVLARTAPVDLATWEPDYGRLAEAQVKWEAAHGRPLAAG